MLNGLGGRVLERCLGSGWLPRALAGALVLASLAACEPVKGADGVDVSGSGVISTPQIFISTPRPPMVPTDNGGFATKVVKDHGSPLAGDNTQKPADETPVPMTPTATATATPTSTPSPTNTLVMETLTATETATENPDFDKKISVSIAQFRARLFNYRVPGAAEGYFDRGSIEGNLKSGVWKMETVFDKRGNILTYLVDKSGKFDSYWLPHGGNTVIQVEGFMDPEITMKPNPASGRLEFFNEEDKIIAIGGVEGFSGNVELQILNLNDQTAAKILPEVIRWMRFYDLRKTKDPSDPKSLVAKGFSPDLFVEIDSKKWRDAIKWVYAGLPENRKNFSLMQVLAFSLNSVQGVTVSDVDNPSGANGGITLPAEHFRTYLDSIPGTVANEAGKATRKNVDCDDELDVGRAERLGAAVQISYWLYYNSGREVLESMRGFDNGLYPHQCLTNKSP
ncbi:MAG: hypothetical protein EYC68_17695 [Chloroflexota bacterium]|nr:MAG: hypothetical protein EYC68_17695 [Chloroflexota bacterium]